MSKQDKKNNIEWAILGLILLYSLQIGESTSSIISIGSLILIVSLIILYFSLKKER